MARFYASKESFELITVLGKPALFSNIRIDKSTVPKGLFLYEIRHDDDGKGDPVQIAKGILVNHFGSIITHKKIGLPRDGYLDIDPAKDFSFTPGIGMDVEEYLRKYPKVRENYER